MTAGDAGVWMPEQDVVRNMLRRALGAIGLKISRVVPAGSDLYRTLVAYLDDHGISHVLDVGANQGQFALGLLENGYRGAILSFEPLPDAHRKLSAAAAAHPNWIVAAPIALSDRSGTATFHVAGNSVSSSLLPMSDAPAEHAPEATQTDLIEVRLERLDDVLPSYLAAADFFLKMDTQGSELDILRGATGVLERITGIMIEMSIVPHYEGQPLLPEALSTVTGLGFDAYHFFHGFRSRHRGPLLECDGLFFRR